MILVHNTNTNPSCNLALEEHMMTLESTHPLAGEDLFMLWQNAPAVIVGRNQYSENEVNREYATEHDIAVVRRLSGGGAVYHDKGNLNFTFVLRDGAQRFTDLRFFAEPLLEVLRSFGTHAEFSGRNDLIIEGKKFSGNAQYRFGDSVLHHGTILWDSDLKMLAHVLKPKARVVARGVDSHKSRVANIAPLLPGVSLALFSQALVARITCESELAVSTFEIPPNLRNKYESESWNWGVGEPCDGLSVPIE